MKIEGRENSIDWFRVSALLFGISISGVSGYYLQPFITDNEQAINTIITIFSILAGFLIAVITFIAEPTIRAATSWKDLQLNKRNITNRMLRHKILFYLYLVSLGLAFSMFLLPQRFVVTSLWIERCFVGISTFVFLSSFKLPSSLMELQMSRYEAELEERKPRVLKKK